MPQQKTKSSLLAKLAAQGQKAHAAHKDDPVDYGNPTLPEGIDNGVAKLIDCRFGEYKEGDNKGKVFFMARGTVVSPAVHNGISVAGMQTKIGPEPLCDTPKSGGKRKTFNDHYAWILNELKKLGADVSEIDFTDLETVVETLKEEGPYFQFRTWKGKPSEQFPNPRVNETWNGVCEYHPEEGDDDVEDSTPTASANGEAEHEEEDEEPAAEEFNEFGDLDSLVKQAEGGDEEAMERLKELAQEKGISEEDVASAEDWAAVAEMITSAAPAEEEEPEEEEEEEKPAKPKKGDIYVYFPIDPKTKKPAKKGIEVDVLSVDAKTQTVSCKNLDTKKELKGIKWSDLRPVS